MADNFVQKTLDALLEVLEIEFKIPLGFAEIKFPVTAHAKKWWKNKKSRLAVEKAIQRAEKRFGDEHPNDQVAQALHEFPLYSEQDYQKVILELLTYFDEKKITWLASLKIEKIWSQVITSEEIQAGLRLFIPFLRDELSNIEEFREVINTARLGRIENIVAQIKRLIDKSASLVELNKIGPASEERLRSFYQGATSLGWDVIIAGGDVMRDQQDDLLKRISQFSDGIKMFCFQGEEASGKSTLAWRVAAELAENLNLPLIQAINEDFWDSLDGVIDQSTKPIIVLADDVFRSPNARDFLKFRMLGAGIILITTSRLNEVPSDLPLPFRIEHVPVLKPSVEEKVRAIAKIKPTEPLNSVKEKDITTSNTWLELMCAITTGDELKVHVIDNVIRLEKNDSVVYRAYEYLCYAGQYDLDVPIGLLNRLDDRGEFYEIHKRQSAKGLIFPSSQQQAYLSVHSTHAKFALEKFSRDPAKVAGELLKAIDLSDIKQRVFIANLLLSISSDRRKKIKDIAKSKLDSIEVEKILAESSMSELLNYWLPVFANAGQGKLNEFKERALEKPFSTGQDWTTANRTFSKDTQFVSRLLDKTIEWLRNDSASLRIRKSAFTLLESKGNPQQLVAVFEQTIGWLDLHPEDLKIRSSFLDFVYRSEKISRQQRRIVVGKTLRWLEGNQGNFAILNSSILLLKAVWDIEQVKKEIALLGSWLSERVGIINAGSIYVNYLDLIDKISNVEPFEELTNLTDDAIRQAVNWIENYPEDIGTREYLVTFITRRGNSELYRIIISETEKWLNQNPLDIEIRNLFINLVGRRGDDQDIKTTINKARQWLKEHPEKKGIRIRWSYINLVVRRGSIELIKSQIAETKQWFSSPSYGSLINFEKAFSFMRLGALYNQIEDYSEAEKAFSQSLLLYELAPARIYRAWCYYRRNRKKVAKEQLDDLLQRMHRTGKHPVSDIYFELGKFWFLEENYINAEENFKKAIQFCDLPNFNPYIYYIELGKSRLALKRSDSINALRLAKKLTLNLYLDKTVRWELDKLIEEAERMLEKLK